jgi:ParB-like chromosome segregation protein Spo0J
MPVVVKKLDDAEEIVLALVEKIQRANMAPLEEASLWPSSCAPAGVNR